MNTIKYLAQSTIVIDAYALNYNNTEYVFLTKREDGKEIEYALRDEFGNDLTDDIHSHIIDFAKSELDKQGLLIKKWTKEDIEELQKKFDTSS